MSGDENMIGDDIRPEPIVVCSPVLGRWRAMNSPATRVPSHGVHAYAQTYAIDLLHEPAASNRPPFGWWPLARRSDAFPGFGQPVLAAADGVVIAAHDGERDHLSRNSFPALAYLAVEERVRARSGHPRMLGNHVIVDLGDQVYALYAHLRRRSVRLDPGQQMSAGAHMADCGNSGNSSEPHLHFQLMDDPDVLVASGLPMTFDRYSVDGAMRSGLPADGVLFEVDLPHGE